MKAELIFSTDGKTVYIQFANGKESLYYESKVEALLAICGALEKKKLTTDEANELFEGVILAENLSSHDSHGFALLFVIMDTLQGMADEISGETPDDDRIENPYAELCNCKHKVPHAYLHNGNGNRISPPFQFKSEGLSFVEYLLKKERINESDSAGLNTLVSLLVLPEDSSLN